MEALRARGHQVELLTTREARALEPGLSPALLGAMYSPLRSQADPCRATQAFATVAARHGARVLTHRPVTALAPRPAGGWVATTDGGEIVAGALVIAAGAWCGPVGAMLGLDIPMVPVRGQMWATAPVPPSVFQTISRESADVPRPRRGLSTWTAGRRAADPHPPRGMRVTRHLYGRQRRNGEIIFGGDRELAGWSTTPEPAGIEVNRGHAAEALPFLTGLPTERTWAGLMPFPLDGKPLIGRIPSATTSGSSAAWPRPASAAAHGGQTARRLPPHRQGPSRPHHRRPHQPRPRARLPLAPPAAPP